MKNYEEIAARVFARRDEYTKKKARLTRTLTPLCCVCLLVLAGVGFRWGGLLRPEEGEVLLDAVFPGIKDHFDELNGEDPSDPTANERIVFHRIEAVSPSQMTVALLLDDFVAMTLEELTVYYGAGLTPTVPADLARAEEVYGIYRRDGGTGEVYWDQLTLEYRGADTSRRLTVTVRRDARPAFDLALGAGAEASVINNWTLTLAEDAQDMYYATFMYKNAGFSVSAAGLTEDEFVAVLASILK